MSLKQLGRLKRHRNHAGLWISTTSSYFFFRYQRSMKCTVDIHAPQRINTYHLGRSVTFFWRAPSGKSVNIAQETWALADYSNSFITKGWISIKSDWHYITSAPLRPPLAVFMTFLKVLHLESSEDDLSHALYSGIFKQWNCVIPIWALARGW